MRIASGKLKGLVLKSPLGIRPTQEIVKKSLFDILGRDLSGIKFLDLFAGSGNIGIEALSLGAEEVILVENDRASLLNLRQNLALVAAKSDVKISFIAKDVLEAVELLCSQGEQFDIIFLDPPYYQDVAKKTLNKLVACDILAPSGQVIVQHYKKDVLFEQVGNLTLARAVKYGETVLSFYFKIGRPDEKSGRP
ncbi:MAG: 16S rRNA (guanine(966)-N(2))-methyltransferase RsmD [Candidatus Omnitrophota bacterium]